MTILWGRAAVVLLVGLAMLTGPQPAMACNPNAPCPRSVPRQPWDKFYEVFLAVPSEGHGGNVVDLSGSGFVPGYHVYVGIACEKGGGPWVRGPVVPKNGTFRGVIYPVPSWISAPSTCRFCALQDIDWHRDGDGVGPVPPSVAYALVAKDAPVPWCVTHICMTVAYRRIGSQDLLLVTGWPGAKGSATVSIGKQYRRQFSFKFTWQGTAVLTLTHAARFRGKTAAVAMSATLGGVTGSDTESLRLGSRHSARRA